jgi:hypothetical protein
MEEPKGSDTKRKDVTMSHQPDNAIQQLPTLKGQQEQMPTETHTSEQNTQDLTEEQLQDVNGGFFWAAATAASMAPAAYKAGKSLVKKIF